MTVIDEYKKITITKEVLVSDMESLEVWLNNELRYFAEGTFRDMGETKRTLGTKALDFIKEAGFDITPPTMKR
jgi:hypothetical protein